MDTFDKYENKFIQISNAQISNYMTVSLSLVACTTINIVEKIPVNEEEEFQTLENILLAKDNASKNKFKFEILDLYQTNFTYDGCSECSTPIIGELKVCSKHQYAESALYYRPTIIIQSGNTKIPALLVHNEAEKLFSMSIKQYLRNYKVNNNNCSILKIYIKYLF